MEKSTNAIKTEKVVLGILELEKVTESDVGGGVGKSDTKVTSRRGRGGGVKRRFSCDIIYEWPLTKILCKIPY